MLHRLISALLHKLRWSKWFQVKQEPLFFRLITTKPLCHYNLSSNNFMNFRICFFPIGSFDWFCRIMRTMVQYWLKDIALFGNAFADMQIIHFYRWLQSPNSLLYDPAIRRTLQTYMKKLCVLVSSMLSFFVFVFLIYVYIF